MAPTRRGPATSVRAPTGQRPPAFRGGGDPTPLRGAHRPARALWRSSVAPRLATPSRLPKQGVPPRTYRAARAGLRLQRRTDASRLPELRPDVSLGLDQDVDEGAVV